MTKLVFNSSNYLEFYPISDCLKQLLTNNYPVFVCLGSALFCGDNLGPKIGHYLQEKLKGKCYVYGTLSATITAKEADIVCNTIKTLHPKSQIIAVDAALGNVNDIGLIKIYNDGIKPGLGVNKNLKKIGDVSIIAIIGEKESFKNLNNKINELFIERLSILISNGIINAIINSAQK